MSENEQIHVHVRTARDRRKALAQLAALRNTGQIAAAAVIARLRDGSYEVLGQEMTTSDLARALMAGAGALASVEERRRQPRREAHHQPISTGETVGQTLATRAITTDADGVLVPPPGETIISCGVCRHPTFHVLLREADDALARFACAHCGNEIMMHEIHHAAGRAAAAREERGEPAFIEAHRQRRQLDQVRAFLAPLHDWRCPRGPAQFPFGQIPRAEMLMPRPLAIWA